MWEKWITSVLAVLLICACTTHPTKPTQAHHTTEGTFQNLGTPSHKRSFFSFMWMRLKTDWVDVDEGYKVPRVELDPESLKNVKRDQVVWLGHSCFLIQLKGINILTDPVFSERASPVSFAGPKRYTPPAIEIKSLPKIHAVVISHNHYDHLDQESIESIDQSSQPLWYVPLKNGELLTEVGVSPNRIIELDWWSTATAKLGLDEIEFQFTATPAQHWSARGLFDRNEMLWSSWAFGTENERIFFGGDTGYDGKIFKEIGERLGPFSLGLIPIGAYSPREFMRYSHVQPEESVEIHLDVRSKWSLGAHWGTFPLTAEPVMDPPRRLGIALESKGMRADDFIAPILGAPYALIRP